MWTGQYPAFPCLPPTAAPTSSWAQFPFPQALPGAPQGLPLGRDPCSLPEGRCPVAAKQQLTVCFTEEGPEFKGSERLQDPKAMGQLSSPPDWASRDPRASPWGGPGHRVWSRYGHCPFHSSLCGGGQLFRAQQSDQGLAWLRLWAMGLQSAPWAASHLRGHTWACPTPGWPWSEGPRGPP